MTTVSQAAPSLALVWTMLFALLLVEAKHLIVDWIWQPPYEHQNKGRYGHFGGIRHAGKNAIGTGLAIWLGFLPLTVLPVGMIVCLILLDFGVHYHIDFTKMNVNRHYGLCPLTHPQFWWLTGADQFLHQVTYLGLIALVVAGLT